MVIAFIVLAIGIIFLLKNLGLIAGDVWDIVWPCLIIALALSLLLKKRHIHHFCDWGKIGKKWPKKPHEES